MSVVSKLQALNFHDSRLAEVSLSFSERNARSCLIEIDYYDWEGNAKRRAGDANEVWLTRRLQLSFGFLAHIEFSAPDLVNRAQDIAEAEADEISQRLDKDWSTSEEELSKKATCITAIFPEKSTTSNPNGVPMPSLHLSRQSSKIPNIAPPGKRSPTAVRNSKAA
jgi:hypothetical protein